VDITIRITTKSGATKRVFRDGWQRTGLRHWDWYVNLEKGTYRIVVTAGDLAGNAQSGTGRAWLRVR